MTAPNGYPGPQGWPAKSPNAQNSADSNDPRLSAQAPAWPPRAAHPHPQAGAPAAHYNPAQWPPAQQPAAPAQQPQTYGQTSVDSLSAAISQSQGRAGGQAYAQQPYAPAQPAPQNPGYAPQFESAFKNIAANRASAQAPSGYPAARPAQQSYPGYVPPTGSPGYGAAAQSYPQPAAGYPQPAPHWPSAPPVRDYDIGSYMPPQPGGYRADPAAEREPTLSDWGQGASAYADDPHGHPAADDLGFAQAAGGELDPAYAEDDQDYDYEDAPRRRRPALVMVALAGAVLVGGGLAYGYKMVVGDSGSGQPPVVKSASEPSKIKPADAGGKQFAHSDSKLMGRLGEGAGGAATVAASSSAEAADLDSTGTRKVATLVVGRDGSIQAPPAAAAPAPASSGVPGLTVVDAFGATPAPPPTAPTAPAAPEATPAEPQVVNAAPQKVVVAPPAPQTPPQSTGSLSDDAEAVAATPPPAKPKKVAAVAPPSDAASAPAPAASPTGANGYVAVLASVPTSSSSRMDALKRYADMQQKYASLLTGKTPDVTEANLGAKGNYHRLVVGPPSSRDQASSLCSQLKSQGYNDCWVTAY
jgi:hypothetical protein